MSSTPPLVVLALVLAGVAPIDRPVLAQEAAPPAALDAALLARVYGEGRDFPLFLESARARREQWVANYERGRVTDELLSRARAVPGQWRLLAVSVDACSDSVSTIPYLARLAEAVETIDLRVVDPEAGRAVMEARRSPDGRATTPTIVLLDAEGRERGCWVEQPAGVQAWWLAVPRAEQRALLQKKMDWYADDAGASTVREVVEMLEAAAAGRLVCPPLSR